MFNPIIEHINKFKETQGYVIHETQIITTPFADDFNLISDNKKTHKKLLTDIESKAKTMGFLFKQSKCRTLSIVSGRSENVTFVLNNSNPGEEMHTHIETVLNSWYHKYHTPTYQKKILNIYMISWERNLKILTIQKSQENTNYLYMNAMHCHPSDITCLCTTYTKTISTN